MSQNQDTNEIGRGGLLKLNLATLGEITSKSESLSIDNKKTSKETSRKQQQQQHRNETDDPNKYKILFNPNNPDKPIYIANSKSGSSNPNNLPQLSSISQIPTSSAAAAPSSSPQARPSLTDAKPNNNNNNPKAAEISQVNSMAKKLANLEQRLSQAIDSYSSQIFDQFTSNVNTLKEQIDKLCHDSFFIHIETACNLNMDTNHWRSCYHHLIETLRKEFSVTRSQPLRDQLGLYLNSTLTEGVQFYAQLVTDLERTYLKFKADHYIDLNYYPNCLKILRDESPALKLNTIIRSKEMKYALTTINRCWISMGDLERYRESHLSATERISSHHRDYSQSRNFYLKAMALAPKSSRAYHQLAILALYTQRRLDACYYYFRCLQVSTPLISVRQSLNSVFEEARLKSETISRQLRAACTAKALKQRQAQSRKAPSLTSNRVEIWHKPPTSAVSSSVKERTKRNAFVNEDSPSSDDDNNDDDEEEEEEEEDNSSQDENNRKEQKPTEIKLNKRFMLFYLNTVGKLFSKVGMESYPETCVNTLKCFRELLHRRPIPLGKMRLLQISVINISIIDLNLNNSSSSSTENCNKTTSNHGSQQSEFSIQFGLDMFTLMSKRLAYLIKKEEELNAAEQSIESQVVNDGGHFTENKQEILKLMPSVKVFIDWMLTHFNSWHPMPAQLAPELLGERLCRSLDDRWRVLIDLVNSAKSSMATYGRLSAARVDAEFLRVKLEEDLELAGFVPLFSLAREDYDFQNNLQRVSHEFLSESSVENAKAVKRLERMVLFADYLCGLEEPVLKYDVENKRYIQVLAHAVSNSSRVVGERKQAQQRTTSTCSNSSLKSSSICNELNNDDEEEEEEREEENVNQEMSQLKERHRVIKAKMEEQNRNEKSQQSMLEQNVPRRIEIEIRPKFIVADTNCFIDHLYLVRRLLSAGPFITIVPLVVINELDKLTKFIVNVNDDSMEHAEYVHRNAKAAMKFLNEKFEKRERNLKAMTSQGSILETIQFRSEEVVKKGTNDELILGCCLHYCRDSAREFMHNKQIDAIHLFREVILLTEDRHLRMKAHTRNVPVKDIRHFCKWSGLV